MLQDLESLYICAKKTHIDTSVKEFMLHGVIGFKVGVGVGLAVMAK